MTKSIENSNLDDLTILNQYRFSLETSEILDKDTIQNFQAFVIIGNSMCNEKRGSYSDGDTVLCSEIPSHFWNSQLSIPNWTFIIVEKDGTSNLRKISNFDLINKSVTLRAINPDYNDVTIDLDCIKILYKVSCQYHNVGPKNKY